jgi:hypothetical protein
MTRTGAREKKKRGASAPSCRMELRRLGVVGQRPEGEGVQGTLVGEDSAQRGGVVQVPQCPALVQTQWSLGGQQRAGLDRDAAHRLGVLAFFSLALGGSRFVVWPVAGANHVPVLVIGCDFDLMIQGAGDQDEGH